MAGDTDFLDVQHLKKYYYGSGKLFSRQKDKPAVKAVNDVSFTIHKGETFGIVGESGCGKSTLGRTIIRLIEPTGGKVFYQGTDLQSLSREEMRLKRKEMQIIFQDPYSSLNPRMTVRDLIKAPLDVFSREPDEKKMEQVVQIMKLVGLDEEYMNKYPHEFSGGQRQRIGIARALILNPKFIFCDEPVSALDVSVRAQVLNLMKDIQKELDLTYMFISHDLSVVRFLCDRVAVMYLGKIVEIATREGIYDDAKHPYTQALLSSILVPDTDVKTNRIILKGDVPSPYNPPSGCLFHTRCKYASKICATEAPAMTDLGNGHCVACHLCKK
jgi:peptide/nickel transport system ATP-binding protein/oligopeptide transport system ATP-binding protein